MSTQHHSAESILGTVRGFMAARVILSGAELDLFSLLEKTALTAGETAEKIKAETRGLTILLDALSALGFLVKKEGRYCTEASAVPFLSAHGKDSILPMLLHMGRLWQNWSRLNDIILSHRAPDGVETGVLSPDNANAFIDAMHMIGAKAAPEIVTAVAPGTARRLLDVGGGSGTYTIAFLAVVPEMKATLFDLPRVVEMARKRLLAVGLLDRVTLAAGDYNQDEFPPGHDLALLSAIIHQNSPEQNLALYRRIFRALEAGGRIVIRDYVMSADRTMPPECALFAVNMLTSTEGGNSYTFAEIRAGLAAAGFKKIRLIREREMSSLVEGFKP